VALERLVQVSLHDGMLITLCVTHVTSSATRASHVLSAGEHIVPLLTERWSSVGTAASKLWYHSLFLFILCLDFSSLIETQVMFFI
jgi:hypothetical protein